MAYIVIRDAIKSNRFLSLTLKSTVRNNKVRIMKPVFAVGLIFTLVLVTVDAKGRERCGLLRTCAEDECCEKTTVLFGFSVIFKCTDKGEEGEECGCGCASDLTCIDGICKSSSTPSPSSSTVVETTTPPITAASSSEEPATTASSNPESAA